MTQERDKELAEEVALEFSDRENANFNDWVALIARALTKQREEFEAKRCHHGWRGSVPEEGRRIVTPCPACGAQSLFIGSGGHLTCARVPTDHSNGCDNPSVERAVNDLRARAEKAESALDKQRGKFEAERNGEQLAAATMNGVLADLGLRKNDHDQWQNVRAEKAESALAAAYESAVKVVKKKIDALSSDPENGYLESDTNAFIWTNKEAEWAAIVLEDDILPAIRALAPQGAETVSVPREQMFAYMAKLRGLAAWLEDKGAVANAKTARDIVNCFERAAAAAPVESGMVPVPKPAMNLGEAIYDAILAAAVGTSRGEK